MEPAEQQGEHAQRDGETLLMLGGFMAVLSLPVMLATIWAGHGFAQVVNFAAGFVIFAIGTAMMYRGWRGLKRLR